MQRFNNTSDQKHWIFYGWRFEITTFAKVKKITLNDGPLICNNFYYSLPDMAIEDMPDEFPTTNMYELEDRVFTENWSIPYKKGESLAKCLYGAIKLASQVGSLFMYEVNRKIFLA